MNHCSKILQYVDESAFKDPTIRVNESAFKDPTICGQICVQRSYKRWTNLRSKIFEYVDESVFKDPTIRVEGAKPNMGEVRTKFGPTLDGAPRQCGSHTTQILEDVFR